MNRQRDARRSYGTAQPSSDGVPFIQRPRVYGDHMRIAGMIEAAKDRLVRKLRDWFDLHPEAEPLIYRRGTSLEHLSLEALRILEADVARWAPQRA